jgi:HSP20 family molecular chaperone IbpA
MARETGMVKQEAQSLVQSDQRRTATPACDIYENKEEVLLVADMPGVAPEALKINLDNDELTLEARRDLPQEGALLSGEFRACDYRRSFVLPSGIDGGKISAELKNGILHLHLPKSEDVKPRQIAVRAG